MENFSIYYIKINIFYKCFIKNVHFNTTNLFIIHNIKYYNAFYEKKLLS